MAKLSTNQKIAAGLLTAGAAVATGAAFAKREEIIVFAKEKVWDLISDQRISKLHPDVRAAARAFINKAEAQGIKLKVTSTLRTFDQQNALFAQGRTTPGNIVTKAKGGQSSHNFGTALDVVPIVKGVADWKSKRWNEIGQIGKSFGFFWGGDWVSFKDRPHFEMNFGNTLAALRRKRKANTDSDGYIVFA